MLVSNLRNTELMLERIILITVLLLPVGGCATSDPGTESCNGQRLIVTTASTAQLAVPDLQTVLAEASGKPVQYMRTLFERHYLFCVNEVADEQALAKAIAGMQDRPEIQAVEPDRRRRVNN